MTGRLGRLGYLIRLCVIGVLYGLGVLLFAVSGKGESLNPLALLCLFFGSGCATSCVLAFFGIYTILK